MAEKFIIELDRDQIEFMAAMTHLYLKATEGDETATSVLDELMMQTNFVYSDPVKHGISTPLVVSNRTPATKWGTKVSEYLGGLSNLSDIMRYSSGD